MTKRKLSTLSLIVIGGLGSMAIARGPVLPAGDNELRTIGGSVFFGFDIPPIPADFFFPGSPPFVGQVSLQGVPLAPADSNADTVVQRLQPANLPNPGDSDTIQIEIVALSLVSVAPIDIGGTLWDVEVDLAGPAAAPGSMTITKMHENGGTWSSVLPIAPRFTFTDVGGVFSTRIYSPGDVTVESFSDTRYTELEPPNPTPVPGGMYIEPCRFGELETADGLSMRLFVEQAYGGTTSSVACFAPDNGSGAADLPSLCPYTTCDNTMTLTDGFPAGSGLNLAIDLGSAVGISTSPGGSLGGTITTYSSDWCMDFTGFGALAGFARSICALVIIEVHNSPLKSGGVMMTIQEDMFSISGSIFGDPDFDTLIIQGGANFGLPSPGHTTLSVLSDGNWNVDSFFDIEYRITFTGAPGSILEGLGGTDTNRTRFEQGCPLPAPSCDLPDNGTGTVNLPAQCAYESRDEVIEIFIDGVVPTTNMRCAVALSNFGALLRVPGGNLGGEIQTFDAVLSLVITGEGALTGFLRFLTIPVSGETHTGPRTPGDAVQDFDTEMVSLSGSLFGDPDFDILSISAGSSFGLPSPGHTTLTQLPTTDWNVDSFFDITYQITFTGAPGGVLDGQTGGNSDVVRLIQGWEEEPLPPDFFFGLPHHPLNYACLSPSLVDGAEPVLLASNIGSSGEDGVSIDLGEAQGWMGEFDLGPVGALPPGDLLCFSFVNLQGTLTLQADISAAASGAANIVIRNPGGLYSDLEVLLLNGDDVVHSGTFSAPFPNPIVVANIGSSGQDGVRFIAPPAPGGGFEDDSFFDVIFAVPGDTQINGDTDFVFIDKARFRLTPTIGFGSPTYQKVELRGGGGAGGAIQIKTEALTQSNHLHFAQGQAHIIGGGGILGGPSGGLRVSNIGSSGLDGVRMETLPPPRSVGKSFVLDGTHSQDDGQISTFIWRQVGTLGGIADQQFQETELPINGTNREINMSSEPWLFPDATVTILSGGVVQLIVPNVPLGGLMAFRVNNNDLPVTFASEVITTGNPPVATGMTHTFVWDFVSDIGVNAPPSMAGDKIQGLPPLTGDEIQIETTANLPLAAGESVVDDLQGIVVLCSTGGGSSFPMALSFGDICSTFIDLCPADTNDSGSINVSDLLQLLAAWGPCPAPCPPDINGEGQVNVTDLLALLAAWGACP